MNIFSAPDANVPPCATLIIIEDQFCIEDNGLMITPERLYSMFILFPITPLVFGESIFKTLADESQFNWFVSDVYMPEPGTVISAGESAPAGFVPPSAMIDILCISDAAGGMPASCASINRHGPAPVKSPSSCAVVIGTVTFETAMICRHGGTSMPRAAFCPFAGVHVYVKKTV